MNEMNEHCASMEELGAILELPAADPRRRHLEDCPRCRALVTSYERFLAGDPDMDPAELAGAEARLSERLGEEIFGPGHGSTSRGGLAGFISILQRPRVLRPALALAAVILVAIALAQLRETDPRKRIILRSEEGVTEQLVPREPRRTNDGDLVLAWSALPGADAYRVQVFDSTLRELVAFETGADTSLVLPPAAFSGLGDNAGSLVWRVQALSEGDEIARSEPVSLLFRIP